MKSKIISDCWTGKVFWVGISEMVLSETTEFSYIRKHISHFLYIYMYFFQKTGIPAPQSITWIAWIFWWRAKERWVILWPLLARLASTIKYSVNVCQTHLQTCFFLMLCWRMSWVLFSFFLGCRQSTDLFPFVSVANMLKVPPSYCSGT